MILSTSNSLPAPPMYGLILAGGKSTRMGNDKSIIPWRGLPHRNFLAQLLRQICSQVFISCRPDQRAAIENSYPVITDLYEGGGPAAAILSAFKKHPDVAWLVLACDLALIDLDTTTQLASERDFSKIATAFSSPHDGLPEPLIAIWEPAAHEKLSQLIISGQRCPRKVLLNAAIKLIEPKNPECLVNVNSKDEVAIAEKIIQKSLRYEG